MASTGHCSLRPPLRCSSWRRARRSRATATTARPGRTTATAARRTPSTASASKKLAKVNRIVVIYEENHSFDNLYGGWERVNGLDNADRAHTTQVDQDGAPYTCLPQNDVNLTSPPLTPTCTDS